MNNQFDLTDEQVRLATSRVLPSEAELDAPTAAARDGFLALGAAIESAGNFDEAALVSRVMKSRPEPAGNGALIDQPVDNRWFGVLGLAALAAGMLLAIVHISVATKKVGSIAVAPPTGPENTTSQVTPAAVAWNDPLDDEIALAAATIEQFSGPSRGFDGSLLDMNDRLEALSRDIFGETL